MPSLAWTRPLLAELMGWRSCGDSWACSKDGHRVQKKNSWEPDEDIAQAIRCLEASRRDNWVTIQSVLKATREYTWVVTISRQGSYAIAGQAEHSSLPRAIVLAIAEAMGWEQPPTIEEPT